MSAAFVRNWWAFLIRGLIGIGVGIVSFLRPGITLVALVLLFGAYALLDGVVCLAGAVRAAEKHEHWGILLLEGIVGIAAAAVTLAWPAITALTLIYLIAGWAIMTGVAEIVAAVHLRKSVSGEWLLGLSGVLSIVFGILIAMAPIAGAFVIALWFGAYAFLFGVLLVGLALRLRQHDRHPLAGPRMTLPAH
jgi:uncharacterized membrane protein HdeD (DUF308 family)